MARTEKIVNHRLWLTVRCHTISISQRDDLPKRTSPYTDYKEPSPVVSVQPSSLIGGTVPTLALWCRSRTAGDSISCKLQTNWFIRLTFSNNEV